MSFNFKPNRFIARSLCLAVLGAVLLTGCNEEEPVPSEIVVSGNTDSAVSAAPQPFPARSCGVKLDKAVEKAVSLSPAATEMICEMGLRDKLVGISEYCDFPEGLSLPKLGSAENPDIDGIIKLAPDAVFTLPMLAERDIYTLERAGIAVLTPKVPTCIEDYSAVYKEIALAFYGNEIVNEQKGETKPDEISKNARKALESSGKSVSLGSFVYITEKLTAAGGDTFESAVLSLSGENLCKGSGYVSAEECEGLEPDYLVVSDKLDYDTLDENEIYSELIYSCKKIIYVNSARFERPSARTAEVFDKIAARLAE